MGYPAAKITAETLSQPQQSNLEQIRAALSPGRMEAFLEQAVGLAAESHARPDICRVLDMKYEPGDYSTILYQLGSRMLTGYIQWDESRAAPPATPYQIPSLGMQIYPFPMDPWLTELDKASDPAVIAQALGQGLPECRAGQARVVQVRTGIQRYRPGKRLTVRLDVTLRDSRSQELLFRTFFGKVYHNPEKARSVYEEMNQLTEIAAVREGRAVLARAAAFLPELSMILQAPVAGTPLDALVEPAHEGAGAGDPRGWAGTRRAAAALAAVHTSGVISERQRPIAKELARFQKRASKIQAVDPAQGRRMAELAAVLPAWVDRLAGWGAELCLTHGDCKPSQFLIGQDQVAILDFDHCGMSDPANDVGTFLATLRQLAAHHSLKLRRAEPSAARSDWLLALEKQFLEDYCAASQRPDQFRLRAIWYEAVGLLRKALRGFGRSPFSPLPGALVTQAWLCLAELPPPQTLNNPEIRSTQ